MTLKSVFPGFVLFPLFVACSVHSQELEQYDNYPTAIHVNLWPDYTKEATTFRIWSPTAEQVQLHFYREGQGGSAYATEAMVKGQHGIWEKTSAGDLHGTYYTIQVKIKGSWLDESPGMYARATGVNGKRAMVVDLQRTHPEGWENDRGPALRWPNEAILYEVHVRDLSIQAESGIRARGKYLGLAESGTKGPQKVATGLDHLKEMGITHVHLLPTCDFNSVDEFALEKNQYNWGYDPVNYNVPEGSYATDPYHGEVRIKEFKTMVKALHDHRIGVVLDVVYNHTGITNKSNFNLEVPGYYYRHKKDGSLSDASACGNETASERAMMRKYMIESVTYWAREYHIDGFRFDLMAIHDIETMNLLKAALKAVNPNILVYGEGWTAGESPLAATQRALKTQTSQMPGIAVFSDEIRDGLKGSVFDDKDTGFVSGKVGAEASVKMGITGCIRHPQVDYSKVYNGDRPWAAEPWQAVLYVSCHDNHTLYDKLLISRPDANHQTREAMDKLANAVVLTSQGIPFLHAGVEMLRSKKGNHNSYNAPDSINQLDWHLKANHPGVVAYYKNMIQLRKAHPAFRMTSAGDVVKNLEFKRVEHGLIAYQISNHANGDRWKNICVVLNVRTEAVSYALQGSWKIAVQGDTFGLNTTVRNTVEVPPISMMILYQE